MADSNFPFPPRHSMYWEDHPYTYDEAKALYEQGTVPHHHPVDMETNGGQPRTQPPERSMMWQDEKLKQEPLEPKTPAKKRKKKPVTPCHLFPVRYALDENDENEKPKHGLPEGWRGNGFFFGQTITPYQYTLRQLRDGWLYVYNETDKTLDEYEFNGITLTKYEQEDYDFPSLDEMNGPTERGQPGSSKPFLTYQSDASIRIAWSKQRWSWPMFYQFATSPLARFYARHVRLSSLARHPDEHVASLDLLEQVSDIDPQGGEIERFSGLVHTKTPDETTVEVEDPDRQEKITVQLEHELKPVAEAGEIKNQIPANEAAYLVAMNDPLSDIAEMGFRFSHVVGEWQDWFEYEAAPKQLMDAVLQLTATDIPQDLDIRYPYLLDDMPRSEQVAVYQEINELFELRRIHENDKANSSGITAGAGSFARLSQAEQEFKKKHGSIAYRKYFEDWNKLSKNRRMVDLDKLFEDNIAYLEQEEKRYPAVERHRDIALKMLQVFGKDFIRKGFADIYSVPVQLYLADIYASIETPLVLCPMTAPQREWLAREFEQPTTMIPLRFAGFSSELYDTYHLYLRSGGDFSLISKDELALEESGATPGKDFTVSYAAFLTFIHDPGAQSHKVLGKLATQLSQIHDSFTQVISAPLKAGATQTVSGAAHGITATLSLVGGTAFTKRALETAMMAESFATDTDIEVDTKYRNKLNDWQDELNQINKKLRATGRIYAAKANKLNQAHHNLMARRTGQPIESMADETDALLKERIQLTREKEAHFDKKPNSVQIRAKHLKDEGIRVVTENINQAAKKAGSVVASSSVDLLVVIITLNDLLDYMDSLKSNNVLTFDEILGAGQRVSATGASLAAVFQAPAWSVFGVTEDTQNMTLKRLKGLVKSPDPTVMSAAQVKAGMRFVNITRYAATFTIVASVTDTILAVNAALANNGKLKKLYAAKGAITLTQSVAGGWQLFNVTLLRGVVPLAFNPWVLAGIFLSNFAVMIINGLISYHEKNDYQQWLFNGAWGVEKSPKWLALTTPEAKSHASLLSFNELQHIQMQPEIEVIPHITEEYPETETYTNRNSISQVLKGVYLNFSVPPYAGGNTLGVMFEEKIKNQFPVTESLESGLWKQDESTGRMSYQCYLPLDENKREMSLVLGYCKSMHSDESQNRQLYHFSFDIRGAKLTAKKLTSKELEQKYSGSLPAFTPDNRIFIEG
ncbi:toxin VasX [Photobacterium halotolerans]|nr:toxin VasX [Photobacterium halotolerans]